MKLSVIIVNYNVKSFLEQCLYSVVKGLQHIDGEIIVVDNNSTDGSEIMIRDTFPDIKLIVNTENIGFARANNMGIQKSSGDYLLILNPDTIIEENTLSHCLEFMEEHPEAGALGPKMIDGKGNYLPESKRSLPTPLTALFKITGLNRLFPKSGLLNHYYLGHLPINQTHAVDVLTGAFMLIRRNVLEAVGLFDESFFMYGEDIDLSYRITLAGYKNYYFPDTTIIHYKGESTKRGSLNYVIVFYNAMKIFTHKHFRKQNAWWFTLLIDLAIYFRALLSILHRTIKKVFPVILDTAVFYMTLYFLVHFWEAWHFGNPHYFSPSMFYLVLPVYVAVCQLSLFLFKSYHTPYKIFNTIKAIIIAYVVILTIYALLPENMRYSRAIIVLGALAVGISALFNRLLLHLSGIKEYSLNSKKNKKIAIIGKLDEAQRIKTLLSHLNIESEQIEFIYPHETDIQAPFFYNLSKAEQVIKEKHIEEIIFCANDMATAAIIKQMKKLTPTGIDFKIAIPGSNTVIGSNSSKTAGDIYTIKIDLFETSN
ncbi:MAG TPA: glycosyltransferase [Bacteroidales bacterium]|nr:glycosyltransferase [Bacteroidales bacterium]